MKHVQAKDREEIDFFFSICNIFSIQMFHK